jgi:hypothetical protein
MAALGRYVLAAILARAADGGAAVGALACTIDRHFTRVSNRNDPRVQHS